ncbi:hypothetical protein [Singulisphaera sp. PoT]|uniref:hypothetical protein n=1 Tax=Singulisphaera sp. PoT TaxID=3411797 RepID=UPI003BF5FFD1
MARARLLPLIIVFLATLHLNRVEAATATCAEPASDFALQLGVDASARDESTPQLILQAWTREFGQADDEVEIPDAPQDEIPDDKGDADEPHSRTLFFVFRADLPDWGFDPLSRSCDRRLPGSPEEGPPRYLSLCRLIC